MKLKDLVNSLLGRLGYRMVRVDGLQQPHLGAFFGALRQAGFDPKHVLDIGANRGGWTRKCLSFFPNAHYTLVEPQAALEQYIGDLKVKSHKIRWLNLGAGDKNGIFDFTLAYRDDASSFCPAENLTEGVARRQIRVEMKTVDEIIAGSSLPIPAMAKIDAEGLDLKVFAGASSLWGKTDVFLLEAAVGAVGFQNRALDLLQLMDRIGYRLVDITDINRSPKHGVLWLCEFAFIRKESPVFAQATSYE